MFVAVSPIPLEIVRPFIDISFIVIVYRYRYRNTELLSVRYIYILRIYTPHIFIERYIERFGTISNTTNDSPRDRWTKCRKYSKPHIFLILIHFSLNAPDSFLFLANWS